VLVVDVDRDSPSGVARQLAGAFTDAGDTCVLVDAGRNHDDTREDGLYDLLRGDVTGEFGPPSGGDGSLRVIGPGRGSSPDLLAGDGFVAAMERLLAAYEFVVFSCASLPRHADAIAIAPRVDAVILAVTAGQTRRPRAIEARDALTRVGARLLGVVLVDTKRRWFW
jgi:hypothetical protein